jgi:hypothetical protein
VKRIVTLIALIAGLSVVGSANAIDVSHWQMCPNRNLPAVRAHNVSCGYAQHVGSAGFESRPWRTRIGGFSCTRQLNAEKVLWLYTCVRHRGQQGIFIVPGLVQVAQEAAVRNCGGLGSYVSQIIGYVWDITSRNVDCRSARAVVRLVAKTGTLHPGQGWTCTSRYDGNEDTTIRCTRHHNQAIRFHAGG